MNSGSLISAKEVGHPRCLGVRGAHSTVLFLVCLLLASCKKDPTPTQTEQAIAVTAAKVLTTNQPVFSEHIGQTRGSREIQIRARVEGFLESIHFDEGRLVKEGDLLYTIDPKTYEAAVAEAEGQLARAEAAWGNAKQDVTRFEPLIKRNAISRQQYDQAIATEKASLAAVESAKAGVATAKLQLGYTKITAPVSGRIGKSEVQVGNLVGRGESTLLTSISTVDPINVRFSVSERDYLEYARQHQDESQRQQHATNRFEMLLADGSRYPHKGSLVFADRNVDLTTGTLLIEVSFPNPNHVLRPGQYARVRFAEAVLTNAVVVPQRAVQELQATYSVFVVTSEKKAESRRVVPGPRVGWLWVITSGLTTNDTVVVEGMQKLQDGALVDPRLVQITLENGMQSTIRTTNSATGP